LAGRSRQTDPAEIGDREPEERFALISLDETIHKHREKHEQKVSMTVAALIAQYFDRPQSESLKNLALDGD
jgi:hypothetical protein